jgi:hypothetical protein
MTWSFGSGEKHVDIDGTWQGDKGWVAGSSIPSHALAAGLVE